MPADTCLHADMSRIKEASRVKDPVTNAPLYVDEPGRLAVSRCVPKEKQEDVMHMSRVWGEDAYWMAIRTAEIDRQIKQALSEHHIRQVVIIGGLLIGAHFDCFTHHTSFAHVHATHVCHSLGTVATGQITGTYLHNGNRTSLSNTLSWISGILVVPRTLRADVLHV